VKLGDDAALNEGDARLSDVARNNENILGHRVTSFLAQGRTLLRVHARAGPSPQCSAAPRHEDHSQTKRVRG
jgi:hypothetical protein